VSFERLRTSKFSQALWVCQEGFRETFAILFGEFIREKFIYQFVLDYLQLVRKRVVSEKS
jgi:hypothetical protein